VSTLALVVVGTMAVAGVVAAVVVLVVSSRSGRATSPRAAPGPGAEPRAGAAPVDAREVIDPIQQLGEVHDLAASVHERIRASHAPLSVGAVVEAARTELGEALDAEAVSVLLTEDDGRRWRTVAAEGTARPREVELGSLPPELREVPPADVPVVRRSGGEGLLLSGASHGAYVWLWSRGQVTGMLVLERRSRPFSDEDRDVLARATGSLGLALSTALVFERLGGLGAGVERQRIGEQLHDRFAQALAFVGLELDRLSARYPDDPDVAALRDEVRSTLGDLRERLRELRLRCTESRGLDDVLAEHVAHVERRTGLRARLWVADGFQRPPPLVEDQLLRMAVDLLDLSRRAEGVTSVQLLLTSEPGRARLVVRDDGDGRDEVDLPAAASRLLDLVRERAVAIDALVDVLPRPGEGTEVAVTVRDVAAVPRWV
jgi:nitrate/nitrite-specific signal transduction histidine kinase